jgi:hypothetical protein
MKFAIMVYESAAEMSARSDPARAEAYWNAYTAYSKALVEGGVAAGGTALQPPDLATTLKVRNGEQIVQDGPYADAKEQLGGFFVITASSVDDALKWAALCPAAQSGIVEVRPVLEMS